MSEFTVLIILATAPFIIGADRNFRIGFIDFASLAFGFYLIEFQRVYRLVDLGCEERLGDAELVAYYLQ